jgi:glutamate:Na+ symporter, ESS family
MIRLQPDRVLFLQSFLAVTTGIVVLFVGKALNRRFSFLREYNIPEPVTGGLVFAAAFWLLYLASGYRVSFELTARDVLLVYFFTTIGINARITDLRAGGRPLVLLFLSVAVFMLLQNSLGVAIAAIFGRPAELGLLAGSVSLVGGHGTAIAWAPAFAERGIDNAMEIGILCATAGLVLASVAGGPVARFLVDRYRLQGVTGDVPEVGVHYGDAQRGIDYFLFLHAILAIHVSAVIGVLVHQWLASAGLKLPLFVPCLFAGILLTNLLPRVAPQIPWPSHSPALALIAELSLGVFLAMSLMSLQLSALAELAGPLLALLGLQLALIAVFALIVTFRVLGRNYDAAVICAGFIGFGLGGTPTAMANMTGVTQRHGASHVAFVIVPLVGAFFIDLLNTIVIRIFLAML